LQGLNLKRDVRSNHSQDRPFIVYPVLVLGIASFAFSPILVRFASDAPGLAIAVWRTTLTVLFLAPFALPRIGGDLKRLSRRDYVLVGLAGVTLGLHFVTWIESLYHTSVASASVLVTMSPLFLAVLGFLFLKERLRLKEVVSIGIAVAGATLIGIGDASDQAFGGALFGNALALLAALFVSVYMLIGRVVRQNVSFLAYVFPLYTASAVTILLMALVRGVPLFSYGPEFYGLCALMALGPQIFGHGSINFALRFFNAALLGLFTLFEPVGASFMAYAFFGEAPTVITLAGTLLVLAAITFTVLPIRRARPVSAEAASEEVAQRPT
jgi:drug/metabolite transporter (DMT)-like permease